MTKPDTKEQILDIARDLLASDGLGGVSFDAIARRLGRSKQAVLYWYPTKNDLLAALFLPWLAAEADAARRALRDKAGRTEAITAFVRAVARFHSQDLDRFRLMYLVPQTLKPSPDTPQDSALLDRVHAVTASIYDSLAEHLDGAPQAARSEAFSIHSAVLGLVLMFGVGDSLNDPLKHSESDLIDALICALTSN
jgi:AcrR family transcriptional regulator